MRDLRETIKYMIRKECERNSLADLCEHWDVSIDDFYTFLNAADRVEAEVERLKMELNEQYVDENDTAWRRPSAEAYYLACKARRNAEAEVERLKTDMIDYRRGAVFMTKQIQGLRAENAKLCKVADAARALIPSEMYQYTRHLFDLKHILDEYDKAKEGQDG